MLLLPNWHCQCQPCLRLAKKSMNFPIFHGVSPHLSWFNLHSFPTKILLKGPLGPFLTGLSSPVFFHIFRHLSHFFFSSVQLCFFTTCFPHLHQFSQVFSSDFHQFFLKIFSIFTIFPEDFHTFSQFFTIFGFSPRFASPVFPTGFPPSPGQSETGPATSGRWTRASSPRTSRQEIASATP